MYKSSQLRSALETVGMRVQSLRLNNFDRWCGNNEGEPPPPPQRCGIALVVTVLMIYRTDTALMIYTALSEQGEAWSSLMMSGRVELQT